MIDRRDIGLKLDVDRFASVPFDLGMATTCEVFQAKGTSAVTIDMLNNLVRTGTVLPATPFSIFAGILSGPFDLDVSSSCNRHRTSSVHNSSSGQEMDSVTAS